ncbi:PKD-like domain-containing protein, partial [Flavobacterium sp. XS2P39]|uniref:PKD-like domain-containing protein n=1 Tax=Flavobacterium sp. XS2P39 TaxID=3401725 RepID=UPI003AABD9D8
SVAYSVGAIANATSYFWAYSGTGATITGSTDSVSITFAANATSGDLTVYGVNACGNGIVSANYAITVNPLPVAAGTITGTSTVCQAQTSVAYSVGAIANATSYFWAYSGTGATITGSTDSVSITFAANATSGDLTVYGVNACGNGIVSANYAITVNPLPVAAGTITGTSTVCQAQASVAYSIGAIANATSYSWAYSGTGATITGSTNSVSITFAANATSGDLTVYGVNACGNGIVSANYAITVNPLPAAAGTITGTSTVCQAQASVAYSVGAIANATSYSWAYSGTGATITGSTNSVSISFAANATSGDLTVYGVNACGNGIVSANYAITVNPLPAAAGTITGTSTVCQAQASVAYSVGAIANATSSSWAYSGTGATITGSTNSVSISFAANATSGNLTVYGVNACGNGTVSANYSITVNPLPAAAGTITGTSTVCQAQASVAYSVGAIANATSYSWAYSGTGATITGSTNSISISFAANATSGNLTVYGVNACGNGTVSANYAITVNPLPAAAGTITGTSTVCQAQASVAYSIGAIANATSYSWAYSGTGATITGSTNSVSIAFAANATSGNLTVYGVNACGNGTVSANYAITVNPLPAAAGTITGTSTVCQAQASVAYSIGAIANATSYSWAYSGTGATITGSTNSVSISFAANATSGNLTVYGVNACGNGTVSANYAITVNPLPAAAGTITGTSTVCQAQASVAYSVGAIANATSYSWAYSGTGATITGSTNSISIAFAANATSGNLTVYGVNACGNGIVSANYAITVNPLPAAAGTITGTSTVCQAQASVAYSVGAIANATSYSWAYSGTGATITGSTNSVSISFAANATSGNLTVYGVNACGNGTVSANYAITINTLSVAPTGITGTTTICAGGSTTLTLNGGTAGTGATAQWFTGSCGGTAAGTGNSITVSPASSTTYFVRYNGTCNTTTCASLAIIVNPLPTATAGGNQTICSNATATVSGASFTNGTISWSENGAGSITAGGTTLTPTYTAAALDAGTTVTLTMTVTSNNACAPQTATATYTIIVNPLPTATAGGTQTICSNATATVSGASSTNGIISWSENGAGSITAGGTTLTPTYSPAAADAGTTVTLTMTVTSTIACTPASTASATYTVIVNPLPTATAGGSRTICSNTTATVSGASFTNGIISWSENGAGSITAGGTTLTPTYTPTAADAGTTVTLTMTVTSNNACTPQTATALYSVIVNPLPTATAGGSQTICSNATATVSGASSTNGTISWIENGAGSITAGGTGLTPTYTAAAADAGNTVTLTMTVTSTIACTTPITATATYTIIVNPLPTATAGGTQTICSNATATVSGASSTNGTILWTENGAGSITAGATTLTPVYTPTVADAGSTVTLTMTVTSNNACAPQTRTATYTIIVNPLPTATAGGSRTICSNTTATVSGASFTNGIISWSENGAGSITAGGTTLTPTYTPTAADAGTTVTLTMTVTSNNACSPQTATASYSVIVNPLPTATAGGSQTICSNATATVSGASSTNGTISWTENGAGSITAGGTGLTPTYTTALGDAGNTVTLTMTVTSTIACTTPITATATYTIIVNPLPTATAGGTQTICSNATATVSGASSTNGTILWTENGAGSITAGATTLTPVYTPTAADAGTTVTLTMTVTSNNACAPQTRIATYSVIVTPLPTATAGGSRTICSNTTANVSGASATNGIISWSENGAGSITAGGTGLTPTYTPTAADAGNTVTLTMTVTSTIPCTPAITATATYTIIVNPLPTASAGGSQTICSNATATVSGANSTNGTISWTENGAGSISAGATTLTPTYTPTAADAGNTVTLTMTVTSTIACTPSVTATATYAIIVNPLPTATAGGSRIICSNTTATVSGASATNGTILWTENGAGSITAGATTLTPTYTAATADAGTTVTLTMTVTSNNVCTPQTATAIYTVIVNPLPIATAGGSKTICPNSTAIVSGASATNGTISWSENGAGSITAGGTGLTPTYTAAPADSGTTVTLTMTVTSTIACTPAITATATYTIIVNPLPIGSASAQTICSAKTTNITLNSTVSNTSFIWTVANVTIPTGGTITGQSTCSAACGNSIAQTLTNSGTTAGVIRYTITPIANNCSGATFTVDVTVNPKPVVTLANLTGQCSVIVPIPSATDNCGVTVTGATGDPLFYDIQGPHTVDWSFDFGNGILISATQNVIVDDTEAPSANVSTIPALNISGCAIASITAPTAYDSCKGTISGTTSTPFPITTQGTTTVTWTYNDGNGNTTTQPQLVTLTAPSISGGTLVGSVTGLTPAATPSDNIAINSCPDDINPITMNLSGQVGTIVRWEQFEAGDTAWSIISNTSNAYDIIFNFDNTKSTLFRVLIQVGNCTAYSNMVNVHAIPPDVPPILDQSDFNICLNDSVSLVARSGYSSTINVGDGGDFDTGQFPDKWDPTQWRIDDQVAGAQWTASGNNTKFNNWSGTNNHPVGTLYKIEYDSNDLKFGIAHGNYNSAAYIAEFGVGPTTLETPLFSLVGLQTAAVEFDQAYNLHAGDTAKLELLIFAADGTTLENTIVLQNLIGTSPQANSWAPVPYPYQAPKPNNSTTTYFDFNTDNSSFDISDYIGNSNVRVKWTFFGTTDESTWAIDNISVPVRPYFDDVEWTDGIGEPGEYIIRNKLEAVYTFVPTAPGVHLYGATSLINGCRAYDADGTAIATVKVNYAYAGQAQGYTNAECGERTVNLNAYDNTKSADENYTFGAYPTLVPNDFSDDPGTGATGKWTVFNTTNTCGTYSFSNDVSPTSSFSGDAGVYTLRWTLVASGCYSDVLVTLTSCNVIDFDGVNDYVEFNKSSYGLGSDFGIEVWIKPDPQPANPVSTIQTIISKRNANSLIDGYDLRLIGNSLSFNWNNGSKIISPFPLTTSRWYHVAVTRTGGFYRLYVDGIEVENASGSAPIGNPSTTCIAGAMDQSGNPPNKPVHHFSGWMDELRIWNTGLDPHHIRQMMNQQIINNGTAVRGEIIPIDINGPDANKDGSDDKPLTWANLLGYYRMNLIDCGYLKPFAGKGADGKLRNITSSQEETAPLPYISIRDGNWTNRGAGTTPWKYGDTVWDYPNSTGYLGTPIDWNIVQTAHNINSGDKDITVLGLLSSAGKLTIADPAATPLMENNTGQGLWITLYLKLNGTIDLVGESQLVQKRHGTYDVDNIFTTTQFSESIFDATSLGYIERDQQGKQNSFNYNYWSSPVSAIQGVINNTPYSLAGVLRDGTDSALPGTISFGDGAFYADSGLVKPIKTSNRWLWSYNSATPDSNTELQDYNQWNYLGSTGLLKTGEGFTMKGSGGSADVNLLQNYVFIGKPNSGTIALPFDLTDQTYLVGNPYPSAIDADEFIYDNLAGRAGVNVFNGALYFWDHFGVSDNHLLAEYEGGYATYTLAGGVKGINDSSLNLNDHAEGDKIPGRYIPVAQSFFVDAALDPSIDGTTTTVDGGTLIFKNSQRIFMREDATNSLFIKKSGNKKIKTAAKDSRSKIRLGFVATTGMHRQLLVTADSNTTNKFDIGYDAQMFDVAENDMYWEFSNSEFVIQALPNFNSDQIIPIGLAIANEGVVTIKIDSLENIPETTAVYLHDNSTASYHNIKNSDFKISLAAGEYKKRFSLQFTSKSLDLEENILNDGLEVLYSNNYKVLIIQNKIPDVTVQDVQLFNLLGQAIENWDVEDLEQTTIKIPVKNVSSGVYIVKIKTSKGNYSKKIIIK